MLRTVKARFNGAGKVYDYFIPEGDNPRVGDIIVTAVDWGPHDAAMVGLQNTVSTATVASVHSHALDSSRATKFYLALVPLIAIGGRQKENEELAARVAASREARRQLDEMLAREDQRDRYARLAARDPRARELMAQLEMVDPQAAAVEQAVVGVRAPIPTDVYWDEKGQFFRKYTGTRMGTKFDTDWAHLFDQFPTSRATAAGTFGDTDEVDPI